MLAGSVCAYDWDATIFLRVENVESVEKNSFVDSYRPWNLRNWLSGCFRIARICPWISPWEINALRKSLHPKCE